MIKWSPSRIDAANYCIMRYYLKYYLKETPLRLSSYLKGNLLHTLVEEFWQKLGQAHEVSKKGRKRYSNAEEFSAYAQRMWDYFCIRGENSKKPIFWNPEIGKKERWIIKKKLEEICYHLFPILVEEGPPLFSEKEFKFGLIGKIFTGFIDEIRIKNGKAMIRDYKSGRPYMGEMKLDFDPQLTIYSVAIGAMAYENEEFAKKLGLEFQRKSFMGNPHYVVPNLQQEFFMLEAPVKIAELKKQGKKLIPKVINVTTRTDNHFFEVIKMIDSVQERIITGNIVAERGRKCDFCDLKQVCKKKIDEVEIGSMKDKKGQFNLEFAVPFFARAENKNIKKQKKQEKDPNQLRFYWRYKKLN